MTPVRGTTSIRKVGAVMALLLLLLPFYAHAQEGVAPEENPVQAVKETINPDNIPSVLFTSSEYEALKRAAEARGTVRAPTQEELDASVEPSFPVEEAEPVEPGIREISLGGIVYTSKNDWSIWLNRTQVTPKTLPEQAVDLVVSKSYIDIKWYDAYTNQIFPIRLRPHQRFNLDSRTFLPGEG